MRSFSPSFNAFCAVQHGLIRLKIPVEAVVLSKLGVDIGNASGMALGFSLKHGPRSTLSVPTIVQTRRRSSLSLHVKDMVCYYYIDGRKTSWTLLKRMLGQTEKHHGEQKATQTLSSGLVATASTGPAKPPPYYRQHFGPWFSIVAANRPSQTFYYIARL